MILIISTQVTFSQLWEECNNGLYGELISSILVNGNKTFVIKNTSLYLTTDDGISWERKEIVATSFPEYSFYQNTLG
ncbi:MAG TPA: hypothetical protein PKV40_09030, partial [Candidatus Kapabacteria bacterium]|nr:hypothetical protein [Candidatus Kapabacteria bacterium]